LSHWKKHRKHYAVIAISLAVAHGLIVLGRELLLKRLEFGLGLAGIGVVLAD